MYIKHAPDREAFLTKRPPGTTIRVVRMATTVLKCRKNSVTSFPAVELTYSFFDGTNTEWVFHETLCADKPRGGFVTFADTLWEALANGECGTYVLIQRSGSF